MSIFRTRDETLTVLAEHGRWMARLRDDTKMLDQRLRSIESRILAVENNLADLAKCYGRLDIALSKLEVGSRHSVGCRR